MSGMLLEQITFFRDLDPGQKALLQQLFSTCQYTTGDIIFEQGEQAEHLYLLVEGEVLVRYKPDDGPALTVARVRPEGAIGWSAALGSPNYTSAAVCSTDCRLLRLRSDDLRQLCQTHPDTGALVLEQLAAVIAERLRNTHEQVISLLRQGLRIGLDNSYEPFRPEEIEL